MKKYNLLLGLIGGILTIAIAPGLALSGMYIFSAICFVGGLTIIDYNRGGC